jgi:hypothetical protein
MVGSPQSPEPSPERDAASKSSAPKVKTFECPGCGSSVTIRTPGLAMSCVCDSCKSVIDVTNDNYKILRKNFVAMAKYPAMIELGTRGKLRGKLWEVIGFMVRGDKGSGFSWDEYLLFNPYYGYRWLTHSEGHWNLVKTIKRKPVRSGSSSYETVTLGEQKYRIFNRGQAVVRFVRGEFYWRVRVDNTVEMIDYICPPYMLSNENDHTETVWAQSEYLEPKEVVEAFKVSEDVLSPRTKIGPNQVSKATMAWREMWKLWLLFFAFLTVGEIVHVSMSENKELLRTTFEYPVNQQAPEATTPVFKLDKDMSNLRVAFTTSVDNSWWFVSGELVNDDSEQSFPFERTCEYYSGVDDGESWSEGSPRNDFIISSVPKGSYHLNLDVESGGYPGSAPPQQYSVVVTENVPTFQNYFWCLLLVSLLPLGQWFASRGDEVQRWGQSDFSPYESSDE